MVQLRDAPMMLRRGRYAVCSFTEDCNSVVHVPVVIEGAATCGGPEGPAPGESRACARCAESSGRSTTVRFFDRVFDASGGVSTIAPTIIAPHHFLLSNYLGDRTTRSPHQAIVMEKHFPWRFRRKQGGLMWTSKSHAVVDLPLEINLEITSHHRDTALFFELVRKQPPEKQCGGSYPHAVFSFFSQWSLSFVKFSASVLQFLCVLFSKIRFRPTC